MPRYNSNFELNINDIDVIEASLRERQRDLSDRRAHVADEGAAQIDKDLEQTAELLGRLHNQKVFYRPKSGAYVSG